MTSFKPNDNFMFYLYFIAERMNIFWSRYHQKDPPYTEDKILAENKFTNVYRVLDRSSQYLLSNVLKNPKGLANDYDTEDIFWRILLYKHFNLPATWDALEKEFGDITLEVSIPELVRFLKEYGKTNNVYSNAYMITAAFMQSEVSKKKYGLETGQPKFELYLKIFDKDLLDNGRLYRIMSNKTFEGAFEEFKLVTGIADFLSYQFIQDLNYSNVVNFDDNSFCAAGPGTIRGIERTFDITGKPDYQAIVKWVYENFKELIKDYSLKTGLDLCPNLIPGWNPTVPDLSNCFCETDKYMRGMGIISEGIPEGRVKQKFKPSSVKIKYTFPIKWGVKDL